MLWPSRRGLASLFTPALTVWSVPASSPSCHISPQDLPSVCTKTQHTTARLGSQQWSAQPLASPSISTHNPQNHAPVLAVPCCPPYHQSPSLQAGRLAPPTAPTLYNIPPCKGSRVSVPAIPFSPQASLAHSFRPKCKEHSSEASLTPALGGGELRPTSWGSSVCLHPQTPSTRRLRPQGPVCG